MAAGLFSGRNNPCGAFQFVDCLAEKLVPVRDKQRWSFPDPGLDQN
jgi:hypothetical protein